MTLDTTSTVTDGRRGWPRAAALFGVVMATSVVGPGVLVAVPLLVLLGRGGLVRRPAGFIVAVLAMAITLAGSRDGLWYAERGWALMIGGVFLALSMVVPGWRVTSRAFAAVLTAASASGVIMASRAGAWATIDWSVTDRLQAGYATWLDAMVVLRQGESVPPEMVASIYQIADWWVAVFPAVIGLESMAALAVSWWLVVRLAQNSDGGLGPLGAFRFNDHWVWLLIFGLILVVTQASDGLTRVGANIAVFMGALYALRGVGVALFISGGISLFGFVVFVFGFVFAAPVVIGFAVLTGIADTWLDLRARVGESAA